MMDTQETLSVFSQDIERTKRKYHGSDWDVPIHLTDHGDGQRRRISARHADKKQEDCSKCPGCRIDWVLNSTKRQRSVTPSENPNKRKRKRSTMADPIKASAAHPEKMNLAPLSPSAISPADLPVVSSVPCADDLCQELNSAKRPRRSVTPSKIPNKRKRSTVRDPIKPSASHPEKMNLAPWSRSAISPADLPVVSNVPLRPEPSSTDQQLSSTGVSHDGPLKIHNYSVEEYQHIYHSVVDEMLRFKSGHIRPYSIALGRKIKQRLWEKLDRPVTSTSANDDGRVNVITSYRVGFYPPLHDIDTFGEPAPEQPPKKRAKNMN